MNKNTIIIGSTLLLILIALIVTASILLTPSDKKEQEEEVEVEAEEEETSGIQQEEMEQESEEDVLASEEAAADTQADAQGVPETDVVSDDQSEVGEPNPTPLQKEYCYTTFWLNPNLEENKNTTEQNIVRTLISEGSVCSEATRPGLGWGPSQIFLAYGEEIPNADKYCVGVADEPYSRAMLGKNDFCNRYGYTKLFNFWMPEDREHQYCVGTAYDDGVKKYTIKKKDNCKGDGWSHLFSF